MFARKALFSSVSRALVVATIAAVAVTAFEPSTARAGSAPAGQGLSTAVASDATDFSARRRHARRGGGNAAAAAAFVGIVGTGLAIAATQNRRHYYYDRGPTYYGGGPVYYGGGQPYYGGGHYRGGYPSNHYGRGGAFDTLTPHHRW
ncbi:MAG: hypothetical protein Q7J60_00730 [Bradyrhizobium sp.]|uniref:hypothetical protein n=1 Tax=Bradyrhizobium sp. TaxID=376 RepID=UPI0027283892|nr:hypothetical protein [Bradyrhizobium sp.]MDO9560123.1 hypothetical protein [Bradyrhizobium sp.]MDP3691289.1 hypothetical protein [Bradyrhizobium sp.]